MWVKKFWIEARAIRLTATQPKQSVLSKTLDDGLNIDYCRKVSSGRGDSDHRQVSEQNDKTIRIRNHLKCTINRYT